MVRLAIVILALVLLESCGRKSINPNSVEGKLVARINSTCQSSSVCTIRVRDVTNFDWDKMYVFKHTATSDQMNKAVGLPLPPYKEFERKMIFVSGRKVVYSEAEPTDVEKPIDQEVIFDIPDDAQYKSYARDSLFTVTKKSFANGVYYELKLVN